MFPEGRIFEFLIVGAVALIVVGPKDLPLLMRKVGRFVAHMRGMAAEFRASFDEMARQSELDELRREVEAMRAGQPLQAAAGLDKDGATRQVFDDIHANLRAGDIQLHPPMSHQSTPFDGAPTDPIDPPAVSKATVRPKKPTGRRSQSGGKSRGANANRPAVPRANSDAVGSRRQSRKAAPPSNGVDDGSDEGANAGVPPARPAP
jgi:sec-independent protein translocase protein TatB